MFTLFVVSRLLKGRLGREWIAVREDEVAAEAMGVPTTQAKVRAFAIGAFFAGAAGCLFAHHLSYIAPQQFDYNKSFEIIIMVVLGGMGSITGSVVAALGLTFLREGLRPLQEWTQLDFRMVIYSLALIVLMLTRPKGLFGTKELSSYFKRKTQKEVST
jgi:branched-chain amino acid transport system permease protein